MPTYAYACTACDHRFEAHQAFSDASLTDCPECQGRLRKLFSSVGVVFKGSGFYRTDSRNGSSTSSVTSSSNSSSNGSSSSSSSDGSGSSATSSSSNGSSAASSSPQPAAAASSSTA